MRSSRALHLTPSETTYNSLSLAHNGPNSLTPTGEREARMSIRTMLVGSHSLPCDTCRLIFVTTPVARIRGCRPHHLRNQCPKNLQLSHHTLAFVLPWSLARRRTHRPCLHLHTRCQRGILRLRRPRPGARRSRIAICRCTRGSGQSTISLPMQRAECCLRIERSRSVCPTVKGRAEAERGHEEGVQDSLMFYSSYAFQPFLEWFFFFRFIHGCTRLAKSRFRNEARLHFRGARMMAFLRMICSIFLM